MNVSGLRGKETGSIYILLYSNISLNTEAIISKENINNKYSKIYKQEKRN